MIATMTDILRVKCAYHAAVMRQMEAESFANKYDDADYARDLSREMHRISVDLYLDFKALIYRVAECDIPPEVNIDALIHMSDIGLKNCLFLYFGFGEGSR